MRVKQLFEVSTDSEAQNSYTYNVGFENTKFDDSKLKLVAKNVKFHQNDIRGSQIFLVPEEYRKKLGKYFYISPFLKVSAGSGDEGDLYEFADKRGYVFRRTKIGSDTIKRLIANTK